MRLRLWGITLSFTSPSTSRRCRGCDVVKFPSKVLTMELSKITAGIVYLMISFGFIVVSVLTFYKLQSGRKILAYSSGVAILTATLLMSGGISELSTPLINIKARSDAKEISDLLSQSKEATERIKTLERDVSETKNDLSKQLAETINLKKRLSTQSASLDCALGDMPIVSKIIGISITIDSINRRIPVASESGRQVLRDRLEKNYGERAGLKKQLKCIDPSKLDEGVTK